MANSSTRWILWEREPQDETAQTQKPTALWGRSRAAARPPAAVAPAARSAGSAHAGIGSGTTAAQANPPREPMIGSTGHSELINEIIDQRQVEVEFQPIFDVVHEQVVGYEALSRGPRDSALRAPDQLFAAARAVGRAGELDWICRAEAFRQMLDHDLPGSISLFVNVAADSLIVECPEDLLPIIWDASSKLRVIIEITGEAMGRHPHKVLETVRRARAARWGVAIGEIEFSAAGLAMLPALEPDVVKVDNHLLTYGRAYAGPALLAALGEAEHTKAVLLVENVEDHAGFTMGRSLGGRYQRGYLHGRPGPLPVSLPAPHNPIRLREVQASNQTPWDLAVAAGAHTTQGMSGEEIGKLTLMLTGPMVQEATPPVIASLTPGGYRADQELAVVFGILMARCPLVLLLGPQVAHTSNWRIRGADLPDGHALQGQGALVALSSVSALVIVTRLVDPAKDLWEVAVSENPALARDTLRTLLSTADDLEGGVLHELAR